MQRLHPFLQWFYVLLLCLAAQGCMVGAAHVQTFQDAQTLGAGKWSVRQEVGFTPPLFIASGDSVLLPRLTLTTPQTVQQSQTILPILLAAGLYTEFGISDYVDAGVHVVTHLNYFLPVTAGGRFFVKYANALPRSNGLRYGIIPTVELSTTNIGRFLGGGISLPFTLPDRKQMENENNGETDVNGSSQDDSRITTRFSFTPSYRVLFWSAPSGEQYPIQLPSISVMIRGKKVVGEFSLTLLNGTMPMVTVGVGFPTIIELISDVINNRVEAEEQIPVIR